MARQIQAAKNITPEAKQIIRDSNVKLTQSDAIALSKLPADEQQEVARQITEGTIKNVPEYVQGGKTAENDEPAIQESTDCDDDPPFKYVGGHYATFAESIADMKNMDKDCSSSPDLFLAEMTSFVSNILPQIQWYSDDYYLSVFPELTDRQMNYLREQLDLICSAADDLYKYVERTRKNELQKKARRAKSAKKAASGTGDHPIA